MVTKSLEKDLADSASAGPKVRPPSTTSPTPLPLDPLSSTLFDLHAYAVLVQLCPPKIVRIEEDEGARIHGKKTPSQLPYLNRNPAV